MPLHFAHGGCYCMSCTRSNLVNTQTNCRLSDTWQTLRTVDTLTLGQTWWTLDSFALSYPCAHFSHRLNTGFNFLSHGSQDTTKGSNNCQAIIAMIIGTATILCVPLNQPQQNIIYSYFVPLSSGGHWRYQVSQHIGCRFMIIIFVLLSWHCWHFHFPPSLPRPLAPLDTLSHSFCHLTYHSFTLTTCHHTLLTMFLTGWL